MKDTAITAKHYNYKEIDRYIAPKNSHMLVDAQQVQNLQIFRIFTTK